MIISKSNRFLTLLIMLGLFVVIIVSVLAGIVLRVLSYEMALANPELQHLRVPVLIIGLVLLGTFIVNLILAEILLGRIMLNLIFTETSVRLFKAISWLFISGIIPLTTLFILTEQNVSGSITQIYVILFGILYLTAGLIFRLWANLIKDASQYKQEIDMTV